MLCIFAWHKDLVNHRKYKMWARKPIVKQLLAFQRQLFFVYLSFYCYVLHFGSRRMASKDVKDTKKRHFTYGTIFNMLLIVSIFALTNQPWSRWMAAWLVGQAFTGIYIGWIFALNHFAMPLLDRGDHFVENVLKTTLNCRYSIGDPFSILSRINDFMTGYLGYQVEHHLFPRMPACNYPKIHDRLVRWVKENDFPTFVEMSAVSAHQFMVNQFAPAEW